jgi:hypothetical protein
VIGGCVSTGSEIVVSCVLILIRASLIAVTPRLVVIRPRLIPITRRLVVIRRRLIPITRRVVAIIHGAIAHPMEPHPDEFAATHLTTARPADHLTTFFIASPFPQASRRWDSHCSRFLHDDPTAPQDCGYGGSAVGSRC